MEMLPTASSPGCRGCLAIQTMKIQHMGMLQFPHRLNLVLGVPLGGTRRVGGLLGVAGRLSGTVSPFRAEQGRARASSCQAVGTTWFFSSCGVQSNEAGESKGNRTSCPDTQEPGLPTPCSSPCSLSYVRCSERLWVRTAFVSREK